MFEETIEKYKQQRSEADMDLITHVRGLLLSNNVGDIQAYDQDRFIIEAHDKTPDIQKFLLNRFWSYQLMKASDPSHDERHCLIPDGTIEEWLALFNAKVLPFAIAHNLPK